jgi:hypothetical protein
MPGQLQTLSVPPSSVSDAQLWNAIRIAFVNRNNPGAISTNALIVPAPAVSIATIIYATLLAAQGQLQS